MVRVFADAAIVVKNPLFSYFTLISYFQKYAGTKLQGKNVSGGADSIFIYMKGGEGGGIQGE